MKNRKESSCARKRFKNKDTCFAKGALKNNSSVEFSKELSEKDDRKRSRDSSDDSC